MKKFTRKLVVALVAIVAVVCMSVSLVACSGGEKKVAGTYMSSNTFRWMNMVPQYNYYTLTFNGEEIIVYEDNTYCLTVNSITYSNVKFGPEVNNSLEYQEQDRDSNGQIIEDSEVKTQKASPNDRGQVITKYYGTCTVEKDSEGDITLTLAKPTRVVCSSAGSLTYDTANWTEEMSKVEEGKDPLTAETYLAQKLGKFEGVEVFVNGTSYLFTYFNIG